MSIRRAALIAISLLIVCAPAFAEKPLTNDDVVKLANLGIGDDAVIAKIHQAGSVDFKLDTDDIVKLKGGGVSGKIIAAMLDRAAAASAPPAQARTSSRNDAPPTADQIEADLLTVGSISAPTDVGMVEFMFRSLADFIDVQITASREKSTIREYDVSLTLPVMAVNNMSALDAFAMMPGAKKQRPDNRPYLLIATVTYAKSGEGWKVTNVAPVRMQRVSGPPPRQSAPSPDDRPSRPASSDADTRTGLGYRVKVDGAPFYDKPEGGKLKGYLIRGYYVANDKGSFLGLPGQYQPEEKNSRTHIAFIFGDVTTGWTDSSGLESFSYSCACEKTPKDCTAIDIGWKKRSWTECFQRALDGVQSARKKRVEELIQTLDGQLKTIPQPGMDIRGIINARAWGQYDTYQGWYVSSLNHHALASATLETARTFLQSDKIDQALDYAELAGRYYIGSNELNKAANEILMHQVINSKEVLGSTYRALTEALKYGAAIEFGPETPAYDGIDWLITASDVAVDYGLEGWDTARRNGVRKVFVHVLLKEVDLPLQKDGAKLLGQSGVYEKLLKVTSNPDFSKELMSELGRSAEVKISDLTEKKVGEMIDGLGKFAAKSADPDIPAAAPAPKQPAPAKSRKH